jgi:PAS domain S-box-containing protein
MIASSLDRQEEAKKPVDTVEEVRDRLVNEFNSPQTKLRLLSHPLITYSITILMALEGATRARAETKESAAKPIPHKQILILTTNAYGPPVSDMSIKGIVDELKRKKVSANDIFVEHLDFYRNTDSAYRINAIKWLHFKMDSKQIGLIITTGRGILPSLTDQGKEFLPNVPAITFFANHASETPLKESNRPTINLRTNKDVVRTLRYALALFPATRRLAVVNTPGIIAQLTNEEINEAIGKVKPQLSLDLIEGPTFEEMIERVGSLPANTIVLYGFFSRDATGRSFIPAEVATELGEHSNAPVFCLDDVHVFNGLMGGSVINGSTNGKRAGELAFDYLNGNINLSQFDTEFEVPYTPLFNWQQLERWKVDISRLPESSVIYNRPITPWQQYKKFIVSTAVVLIVQTVLIILLGIENRRRKHAEQIAENERQRLKGIITGTNVGTWEWNVQTGELFVNEKWSETIGYTIEGLHSPLSTDAWTQLVHPDDLKTRNEILEEYFQGRRDAYQLELRIKHKDGSWRWLQSRGKVFSWTKDGKPLMMMGTHENITERKLALEAIKQNELRLAKLVDILQHPNKTIQDLLDYTLEQIIQLTQSKIGYIYHYNEDSKKLILDSCSKKVPPAHVGANPQTQYELENTGTWSEAIRQRRTLILNDFQATNPLKKDYPEGPVHISKLTTIPIFRNNRIVSLVILANKETDYNETDALQASLLMDAIWTTIDKKQIEEEKQNLQLQLLQTQKMESLGVLAGGIAHDFNNILSAIIGYAELAQEDCPAESATKHDIDQVIEASLRARELVRQILAFSRQTKADQRVLQPAPIIKETIKMLRASLPTTIDIQQNIDMNAGPILADSTQIHQLLTNLCTNAFHAMEETGGTLTISLKNKMISLADLANEPHVHPGLFVDISVSDTGPGISPQIIDKIFDPFFTTKEVGKGTGMGLAIIHGIAKKSGGFVSCQSSREKGTIFNVYIPIHDDTESFETEKEHLIHPPRGNERILFVDDEKVLAELGKTMLERLGYRVTSTTSSLEALTIIQKQPGDFDLVITDQTMPGITGSDLARRILQIRPGMPIILCTGFSTLISEENARAYGIKGFAPKPLATKDLAVLIRRVMDEGS